MTCPDCQAAATAAHHGFRASCSGCKARAFSRGPHFFEAKRAGKLNPVYLQQLERLGLTHDQVKAADADDFMRREVSR